MWCIKSIARTLSFSLNTNNSNCEISQTAFQSSIPKIFNQRFPRFSINNSQDFQSSIPKIFNQQFPRFSIICVQRYKLSSIFTIILPFLY